MSKKPELSPTHWRAIKLIVESNMSMKEIASVVGLQLNTLYKLAEGNPDTRKTGQLFYEQIRHLSQKKSQKDSSKTKDLILQNKWLCLQMINDYLYRKIKLEHLSDDEIRIVVTILNSMYKTTPAEGALKSTSYSYIHGLSSEDMVMEFQRLTSILNGLATRKKASDSEK